MSYMTLKSFKTVKLGVFSMEPSMDPALKADLSSISQETLNMVINATTPSSL